MPCYRGSPGSGILAKIKFNKYFKIKKNENIGQAVLLFVQLGIFYHISMIDICDSEAIFELSKRRKIENS
jgi:hypothetical protein